MLTSNLFNFVNFDQTQSQSGTFASSPPGSDGLNLLGKVAAPPDRVYRRDSFLEPVSVAGFFHQTHDLIPQLSWRERPAYRHDRHPFRLDLYLRQPGKWVRSRFLPGAFVSSVRQVISNDLWSIRPPESESVRLIHARLGSPTRSTQRPRDQETRGPAPKKQWRHTASVMRFFCCFNGGRRQRYWHLLAGVHSTKQTGNILLKKRQQTHSRKQQYKEIIYIFLSDCFELLLDRFQYRHALWLLGIVYFKKMWFCNPIKSSHRFKKKIWGYMKIKSSSLHMLHFTFMLPPSANKLILA